MRENTALVTAVMLEGEIELPMLAAARGDTGAIGCAL